jgi:hypothetical protein
MKIYTIKISSGSKPQGVAPYFITLNPSNPKATKRYETREELGHALRQCAKMTGLDNVLAQIGEKGFITVKSELTEESAKRLGWNR